MIEVSPALSDTLQKLSFMEGEWDIVCKIRETAESEWTESKATANTHAIMDGKALQEHFSDDYIKGTNIFCFNEAKNVWQNVWIDTDQAYLSIAEGNFEGDNLVFLGKDPFHNNALVKQTFSDIQPRNYTWTMEYSEDDGKTWWISMQFDHTKRG